MFARFICLPRRVGEEDLADLVLWAVWHGPPYIGTSDGGSVVAESSPAKEGGHAGLGRAPQPFLMIPEVGPAAKVRCSFSSRPNVALDGLRTSSARIL